MEPPCAADGILSCRFSAQPDLKLSRIATDLYAGRTVDGLFGTRKRHKAALGALQSGQRVDVSDLGNPHDRTHARFRFRSASRRGPTGHHWPVLYRASNSRRAIPRDTRANMHAMHWRFGHTIRITWHERIDRILRKTAPR